MLFLLSALCMSAQGLKVTGSVVDMQTGDPLIGVSIVEKGTTNGIVTDIDGNFTLKVSDNAVLQLSYIGYASKEVRAKSQLGVIEMESEAIGLSDVTITGQVAIQRKTPVAVSQISAIEIEERLGGQEFPEVLKNTSGLCIIIWFERIISITVCGKSGV